MVLRPGETAITADLDIPNVSWHQKCFVCSKCKMLLSNLLYYKRDNAIFCKKHFIESEKIFKPPKIRNNSNSNSNNNNNRNSLELSNKQLEYLSSQQSLNCIPTPISPKMKKNEIYYQINNQTNRSKSPIENFSYTTSSPPPPAPPLPPHFDKRLDKNRNILSVSPVRVKTYQGEGVSEAYTDLNANQDYLTPVYHNQNRLVKSRPPPLDISGTFASSFINHSDEMNVFYCAACDLPINSRELIEAENRTWHIEHFTCFKCNRSLGGQKYYVKNAKSYCIPCHRDNYAKV
jgi:hypothetical protein